LESRIHKFFLNSSHKRNRVVMSQSLTLPAAIEMSMLFLRESLAQ